MSSQQEFPKLTINGDNNPYKMMVQMLSDFGYCEHEHEGNSRTEWLISTHYFESLGYTTIDGTVALLDIVHLADIDFLRDDLENNSSTSAQFEFRVMTASQVVHWLRLYRFPVFDDDTPTPTKTYYFGQDITPEKTASLRQKDLIGHIPHELSQPITAMLTRLYMLRRQPERLEDHLEIADQLINGLKIFLYDLQLLSRIEREIADSSRLKFSLTMLMEKVIGSAKKVADRHSVQLNAKLPPTPINLKANYEQLDQALTGLISHIVYFSPEDVMINVICRNRDGQLVLDIYDPGEPIDEAMRSQIFHPFARRASGVDRLTGLELTIADAIIALHGGSVSVESLTDDEQGTFNNLFRVTLPLE